MDKEQMVHDLAMACLTVKRLHDDTILVEQTVQEYQRLKRAIQAQLEETQD